MGPADVGVGEIGSGYLDVGSVLCCGATGGSFIWYRNVDFILTHWDELERIPPQGGPQTDGAKTAERGRW